MSFDAQSIRQQFRFFRDHPNTIYFDNAATTQKPDAVIEAIDTCWKCSTNVGRSSYQPAARLTEQIEQVRTETSSFINAHSPHEIVFTSGATHSLNLVALGWCLHNLQDGDEILYSPYDHKSNVLPWFHVQSLLKKQGVHIILTPYEVTFAGDADIADIVEKTSNKTRLIALTHIHNVFGAKTQVERLRPQIGNDVLISVDAAQSVGHIPVNVQELGIDFLSFSGHKMFAASGTGVLWVAHRVHNQLQPVFTGGGELTLGKHNTVTHCAMPSLLETGSPNAAGILSLGAAIRFLQNVGIGTIHERLLHVTQTCIQALKNNPRIEFIRGPAHCPCSVGYGTLAFNLEGVPAIDVGFILDQEGIYVRTGGHCRANADSPTEEVVRISMQIYNTEEEIERCVQVLHDC